MGAGGPSMRSLAASNLNRPQRIALFILVLAYSYVGCDYIWRSSSTAAACLYHRRVVQSQLDKCMISLTLVESRGAVEASAKKGESGDGRPNTAATAGSAGDLGSGKRKLLSRATSYLGAHRLEGSVLWGGKGPESVSLTGPSEFWSSKDTPRMRTEEAHLVFGSEISSRHDDKGVHRASGEGVPHTESVVDKFARRRLLAEKRVPLETYVDCSAATGFAKFLDYQPHQPCPDDWTLTQALLLDERCLSLGLPRRNCFARMPTTYKSPIRYPDSLWAQPQSENVRWTLYPCKSYDCLNNRTKGDCRECFMFSGEARRWVVEREGKMNLEQVLKFKGGGKPGPGGGGSVRVALDVGGGTASFAAQMAAYDVIVMTTGINIEAPFLETIAQRGLIGLHMSHLQRLPLFDGSMDMIHSMHSVQFLIPELFKSLIFDWDRCLRPGGLLWLEYLYIPSEHMRGYEDILEMMGYKRHEWFMESYFDNQRSRKMKRLSVVLEKPLTRNMKIEISQDSELPN